MSAHDYFNELKERLFGRHPGKEKLTKPQDLLDRLPTHYKFIAMDKNKSWYAYISLPTVRSGGNYWVIRNMSESYRCVEVSHMGICFSGPWKDSLFERESTKDKLMEPQEIFDHLDDRYKFIAMDKNKKWYAYHSVPSCNNENSHWRTPTYDWVEVSHMVNCFDGYWRESVFQREPVKEKLMNPQDYLNQLSDKYNFLAMDKNGEWYAYAKRPHLDNNTHILWYSRWENAFSLEKDSGIFYEGHWTDSLFERESTKEKLMQFQELFDHLPARYNFIAMDEDKRWHAYTSLPTLSNPPNHWRLLHRMGGYHCLEVSRRVTSFQVAWKESLVTRDPIKEKLMEPHEMFDHLSDNYKFIAMDKDRRWWAYPGCPTLDVGEERWFEVIEAIEAIKGECLEIDSTEIYFRGDWKESLFQRESTEKKLMEPHQMFDHLSDDYKFIAMDKDRGWDAYPSCPTLDIAQERWIGAEEDLCRHLDSKEIHFGGEWENSLFTRIQSVLPTEFKTTGTIKWEYIKGTPGPGDHLHTSRTPVYKGWIVKIEVPPRPEGNYVLTSSFVPDPNHEWRID